MKYLALLAIFAAFFCVSAYADCSVNIKQTLGSAWQQDGKNLSQWNVAITAGSEAVKSLELTITGATINQLWELTKSNNVFALPDWRLQNGGIPAGQTHQFGYIWQSASQATIAVSAINCGAAASASPAAPSPSASAAPASPSASPAAPSPSASPAAPTPSPSTIVSTPQPSSAPAGCSVKVAQTTRSSQDGSWTTGDFKFQIYDLVFTNNGNQPATGIQFSVALNANQEIYQFWNVERQSANSNAFNVPTSWGPLQVGATLGAGYIVRSPVSAGNIAAPAVTITSTTCSGSSTAAPSPSAAPASPSASPAAPSASPSANPTIVATPQPSSANGCSASVSIVARSAASGGVWTDNGNTFQIFDISLQNKGQRAVNGGVFTFGLQSGASISQFWELNRQGSSNAFNVAFNYGPLQAGASQGSGIIVQLAGSSPAAVPSVTLSSLACQ